MQVFLVLPRVPSIRALIALVVPPVAPSLPHVAVVLPKVPAGRAAEMSDCVGAAVYLASRASDMVHGHLLLVDGGYTVI